MTPDARPHEVGQTSGLPVAGTSGSQSKRNSLVSGIHSRGALPHLKREGASYFVTFRLAGTIPREVLLLLKREREAMVERAQAQNRPLTWREQKELFNWYSEKVDAYLDAGHGACWLKEPKVAGLVAAALRFFEGQRYTLRAWVIMPNHVHAVVHPESPHTLSSILKSWKGYTAVQANRLLNRSGQSFWQSESYDHSCRDDDDRARCCAYTIMNPVNARLCARPEDWLWSSAHGDPSSGFPDHGVSDSVIRAPATAQPQTRLQRRPELSGRRPDPRNLTP